MRQDSAALPIVLAVDDDAGIRTSLGIVLEEHCELVLAADGADAIDTLQSRTIDVVLLDLLLPRMHGHDVLARIRTTAVRTPVIVLTALTDPPTVVKSMKLGAWDYLTKPWEDDHLIALVRQATWERRQEAGVLLVSDDVAALAPLQLALESRARVLATNVARAVRAGFPATVIVLESRASVADDVRIVHCSYPGAALVIITDIDRARLPGRASGVPIAAVVNSARPCTVLRELVAVRAIDDVPPPHAAVTAALNFIADHHDACLTVRRIAKAANLSEDHLAHVFRDATGLSVKDYVTRLRMTIARRLLTETTDTVEAIATRVGFADGSTFSRTFKNVGGMAPGEFRRSQP